MSIPPVFPDVDAVANLIRAHRFRYSSELMLQTGIAGALTEVGETVEREVRLNTRDRIDLMVGRVGIEVKVNGTARDVARQVERYLASPLLDGIVVVSARVRHVGLHGDFGGKPVRVVTLAGGGF